MNNMAKLENKIACDYCKKKIKARIKEKHVGKLHLNYLWCAKCKTVYPSFIHNEDTRNNIKKIESIQEELFGANRVLAQEGETEEKVEERVRYNKSRLDEMSRLKKENVFITKRLIQENIKLFDGIGERVIYK